MMTIRPTIVIPALLVAGCATAPRSRSAPEAAKRTAPEAAAPAPAPLPPAPPKLDGLGAHTRSVSHASAEAQPWFDQGLNLVYGFNHDESIKAFAFAAALSPSCAMCFWGVAYANGPHINNPAMSPEATRSALAALEKARTLAAEPVERALLEALAARYVDPPPADRAKLDGAYAEAMRVLHKRFPADADVAALTAEALMDLHPWDLHTTDGRPQPWTAEVVKTIQAALALSPRHPLANHLLIHAVEASVDPARAEGAADVLRDSQPGLGHMVHMPSHIDVRTGQWQKAIDANEKAIAADTRYRKLVPRQGFYTVYMLHNQQMLSYAAMMSGRGARAIAASNAMVGLVPDEMRKGMAAIVDPYLATPLEVMMRFGRWDELLAVPDFADDLPASRALRHAARGVAYAAKHDLTHALEEQTAFEAARARVPADAVLGNNKMSAVNDVAGHLLAGEILYAQNKQDQAFGELRKAVAAEDQLHYDEPPDWIQPTRHALGAALAHSKKFADAEAVFREDLRRIPGNGWALFGLAQALRMQGNNKRTEAAQVEKQFDAVWSQGDVKLQSACLCQPGI